MGFLGNDDESENSRKSQVEEVSINIPEEESESRDSSSLKSEAEKQFTGSSSSKSVSLEDVHRQNEKIISMLEDLQDSDNNSTETDMGGAMDGVL